MQYLKISPFSHIRAFNTRNHLRAIAPTRASINSLPLPRILSLNYKTSTMNSNNPVKLLVLIPHAEHELYNVVVTRLGAVDELGRGMYRNKTRFQIVTSQESSQRSIFQSELNKVSLACITDLSTMVRNSVDVIACDTTGLGHDYIDRLVTQIVPNVVWFHCFWTGVDRVLSSKLKQADKITLTNAKSAFSESLGEYAIAAMLYFAKKMPKSIETYRGRKWSPYSVTMLKGKSLGIVGYGNIGKEVAKRAKYGFGMKIVAVKRRPEVLQEEERQLADTVCASVDDRLLCECDFIVSALPGTARTHHYWNRNRLMNLKKGSVFVNLGRGNNVDESAICEAVQSGHLKGIALDVFETEPLISTSHLYDLGEDKALLTPHCVDRTQDYWELSADVFVAELNRFYCEDGNGDGGVDALVNVVSKQQGY
eukprot:CFRG5193T1